MKYKSCLSLIAIFVIAPALAGVLQQDKVKFDFDGPFTSDLMGNHDFDPDGRSTRIIGGEEATRNQFPYQLYLSIHNIDLSRGACGGVLISSRFSLTAAHCLDRAIVVTVLIGAYNTRQVLEAGRKKQVLTRLSFVINQNYNRDTYENDIALMKLLFPVQSTTSIQPIALPSATATFTGMTGTVSGWGVFDSNDSTADILRFGQAPISSDEICEATFGDFYKTTHLCWDGSEGRSICSGDSGGPLVVTLPNTNNTVLVGLASFGSTNCFMNLPAVFTEVSKYLAWIQQITGVSPPN